MAEKEVTEKKESKVVAMDMAMFEADAGAGMSMDQDDLALPFLKVLSALDPLIQEGELDAKPGDLYNTVTGTVYPGKAGVKVIPAHYERRFLQWAPRGSGSGAPQNIFGPADERPATKRDDNDNKDYVIDGDGAYIDETHQHYVVILEEDGSANTALISMKSTQLKKSRKWNSMIASRTMTNSKGESFQPPRFSHVYKLSTSSEKNDKGSWHGWNIELDGKVEDANVYRAAKAFHDSIASGNVTVKHEQETNTGRTDEPF
jgi:hypothetical protein